MSATAAQCRPRSSYGRAVPAASYTLGAAHQGKTMRVRGTVSKVGYTTVSENVTFPEAMKLIEDTRQGLGPGPCRPGSRWAVEGEHVACLPWSWPDCAYETYAELEEAVPSLAAANAASDSVPQWTPTTVSKAVIMVLVSVLPWGVEYLKHRRSKKAGVR